LVGIFGGNVPAVGFSIGIERVFTIIENRLKSDKEVVRTTETDVLVASIDKGQLKERMKICAELWAAGIKAELLPKENPKIQQQLTYASNGNIPFAIIFGASEITNNTLNLKNLFTAEQTAIARADLIPTIQRTITDFYASGGVTAAAAVRAKREAEGAATTAAKDSKHAAAATITTTNNNNKDAKQEQ